MDIVQILPDSAPVYIGGGGPPSEKPIEVEVYTSGVNGNTYLLPLEMRGGAASNTFATN